MRRDGVEIKVTFRDEEAAPALTELGLADESKLRVWFFDDVTPGVRLPLLDAGVVIRARDRGDDSDCTVKLRPCRASQLTPPWADRADSDALELAYEQDWAGKRRAFAVSARADLPAALLGQVEALQPPPRDLLTAEQADFLARCAPIRVNLDGLAALGPIEARRWRSVPKLQLPDLEVRAEQWTVPGLTFLELSIRVDDPSEADAAQQALEGALTGLGLPPNLGQDTKTRTVLELLAGSPQARVIPPAPAALVGATDLSGAVVFFDIGDTLATVTVSPSGDSIVRFLVHPQVPGILSSLRQRGARLGVISNRGAIPPAEVDAALSDSGLADFLDPLLVVYGPKDTPAVFQQAAALAGNPQRRVYVGEDAAERTQAARAGFLVAPHPELAVAVLTAAAP